MSHQKHKGKYIILYTDKNLLTIITLTSYIHNKINEATCFYVNYVHKQI